MSGRVLLDWTEDRLVETHGREEVDAMLDPPAPVDERAERAARLAAMGGEVTRA